jgi:hypothetical protein
VKKQAFQELLDDLDNHLAHAIVTEGKMQLDLVTNYDEVSLTPTPV